MRGALVGRSHVRSRQCFGAQGTDQPTRGDRRQPDALPDNLAAAPGDGVDPDIRADLPRDLAADHLAPGGDHARGIRRRQGRMGPRDQRHGAARRGRRHRPRGRGLQDERNRAAREEERADASRPDRCPYRLVEPDRVPRSTRSRPGALSGRAADGGLLSRSRPLQDDQRYARPPDGRRAAQGRRATPAGLRAGG